jgi:hypothetical protein
VSEIVAEPQPLELSGRAAMAWPERFPPSDAAFLDLERELLEEDEAELHAVAAERLNREIDRQLLHPACFSSTAEGVFV